MFELSIKCSKDIDEIHINFSDGTSTIVENEKPKKEVKPKKVESSIKNNVNKDKKVNSRDELNLDEEFGGASSAVAPKPEIVLKDRDANVSESMQNLEL